MNDVLATEISRLSQAEKLLLVEELWDQIAKSSDLAVPPAHREELDRRLAAHADDAGRPWHEVHTDLLRR